MGRKDIQELEVYQIGMQVGKDTYNLVFKWDQFNKNTIGYQLIRAVDSIAANIAEGYGRYHYKEQRQFCYIARGSLYETKTWLHKANERRKEDKLDIQDIIKVINQLHIKLNAYIKYIDRRLNEKK